MKATDLTYISEPVARFVQSHKFLRSLRESEIKATAVRDEALLELRKSMSQQKLADLIGVSQQFVTKLEAQAKKRRNSVSVRSDGWRDVERLSPRDEVGYP